ncbi:MAG: hypothetical protein ACI8Z1_002334 [Candidatus Azotimanducaceae bacterium]
MSKEPAAGQQRAVSESTKSRQRVKWLLFRSAAGAASNDLKPPFEGTFSFMPLACWVFMSKIEMGKILASICSRRPLLDVPGTLMTKLGKV